MMHKVRNYVLHWQPAADPNVRAPAAPAEARARAKSTATDTGRCDVCGELYDLRHSYEVLHHLHGRRYDETSSPRH